MTTGQLLLVSDATHVGGVATGGFGVVTQATGAAVSTTEIVPNITGLTEQVIADGVGGYLVYGEKVGTFPGLVRYSDAGVLDAGFSVVLTGTPPGGSANPRIFQVIQDGTGWLLRGSFTTINAVARNGIARISATGMVDGTWPCPSTGFPGAMALHAGKLVYSADNTLYRISGAGVDGTFTPDTFSPATPTVIYHNSDGTILAGGNLATVGGVLRTGIIRLRPDVVAGDATIAENVSAANTIVGLRPYNGGLIVFGNFVTAFGNTQNKAYALDAGNALITTFQPPVINGTILNARQWTGTKVIICGDFTTVNAVARNRIAVLNADGTLDLTWVPPVINGTISHLHVQGDGKVIFAGAFTTIDAISRPGIARLTAAGAFDATFAAPVPVTSNGTTVSNYSGLLTQSDGKCIAWGPHRLIRGQPMAAAALINNSLAIASTFVNLVPLPVGTVLDAVELSSGKILIRGEFTTLNAVATWVRLARLNADGTLDTGYPTVTGPTVPATGKYGSGILKLASGKILVYGGTLMLLNSDGTVDSGYSVAVSSIVYDAAQRPDGKIVLIGAFTTIGGFTYTRMALLNSDATVDSSFTNPNVSSGIASTVRLFITSDNKTVIYRGGASFTVATISRAHVAMVNADGTLNAWNPAPSAQVVKVAQQTSGKLIVGGDFATIGGGTRSKMARLNTDGTNDAAFANYTAYTANITDFHLLGDDRFVTVRANGVQNRVSRMTVDNALDGTFTDYGDTSGQAYIYRRASGSYIVPSTVGLATFDADGGAFSSITSPVSGGAVSRWVPVAGGQMALGTFLYREAFAGQYIIRMDAAGATEAAYPGYFPAGDSGNISNVTLDGTNRALIIRSTANRVLRLADGSDSDLAGFPAGTGAVFTGDGKVYQQSGGLPVIITRLNSNGVTVDSGYGTATISVSSLGIIPDSRGAGVFLTSSSTVQIGGAARNGLAKFSALGVLDGAWTGATYVVNRPPVKVWDAGGGKVYVVSINSFSTPTTNINRLTTTGAFDTWIGGATTPLVLYSPDFDGTNIVGWSSSGTFSRRVLKYNSAGTTVAGWLTNSPGNLFSLSATITVGGYVKYLASGEVLVWGAITAVAGVPADRVVVMAADGTLVSTFQPKVAGDLAGPISCDARSGNIYMGGGVTAIGVTPLPQVARRKFGTAGHDVSFRSDPYINPALVNVFQAATTNSVAFLPDGRAYVGGKFLTSRGGTTYGNVSTESSGLTRLLPDGSPDATFSNPRVDDTLTPASPQERFSGIVRAILPMVSGSIVIAGYFNECGGLPNANIARLNYDGTAIVTFNATLNAPGYCLAERADGKIWAGGEFTTVNAVPMSGLVLLDDTGLVTAGWANPLVNINAGLNRRVLGVAAVPGDKVIVVGTFIQINGLASDSCVQFNSDGTRDLGFDAAITGVLTCVARDAASGKIYVGAPAAVFRLNADGSADVTFVNPFSGADTISSLAVAPDGKLFVTGEFNLSGHRTHVLLDSVGAVSSDLSPLLMWDAAGGTAFVAAGAITPPPPVTVYSVGPTTEFQSRAATVTYKAFGGTPPYTYELVGEIPTGLTLTANVATGTPSAPGVKNWRVNARDSAGGWAAEYRRLQVLPSAIPGNLLAFSDAVNRITSSGGSETEIVPTNAAITKAVRIRGGKILIIGTFSTVAGATRHKIARLNADGTLDAGFVGPANSTVILGNASDVVELSTGKIVVTSSVPPAPTGTGHAVGLNIDGTLDAGFTLDARVQMRRMQRVILLAGDVLLFGGANNDPSISGFWAPMIFKTSSSGVLDTVFLQRGFATPPVEDYFVNDYQTISCRFGAVPNGGSTTTGIYDLVVKEDGDYLAVGSFISVIYGVTVFSESILQFTPAGLIRIAFTSGLREPIFASSFPARPIVTKLLLNSDGKSYTALGAFTTDKFSLLGAPSFARIDAKTGALIGTAAATAGAVPAFTAGAYKYPDGRIIAYSSTTSTRIYPDGVLDAAYTTPATVPASILRDDLGLEGFVGDGMFSLALEQIDEVPDMWNADGAIYFQGVGVSLEALSENLNLAGAIDDDQILYLLERLLGDDTVTISYKARADLIEALSMDAELRLVMQVVLADTAVLNNVLTGDPVITVALLDSLLLTGAYSGTVAALAALTDGVALLESMRSAQEGVAVTSAAFTENLQGTVRALENLVATAVFADASQGMSVLTVLVPDTVVLGQGLTTSAVLQAAINEAIAFSMSFTFADVPYYAVTMNTASKAVTEYVGYNFNSIAGFNGSLYGSADAGLYRLEGETDAGTPIAAYLRTAMQRLAQGRLPSISDVYLGFRGDGQLQLKIVATDPGDRRQKGYVFDLIQTPTSAAMPGRFKVGKGLQSVYMAFELGNVAGSDFAIDVMEVHPLVSYRRLP